MSLRTVTKYRTITRRVGPAGPAGAATYAALTDAATVDLPTLNTPLAAAIAGLVSGGVPDGNKGSITVSASGATWTINTGAVTNAMLAGSIALSKLATDPLARANHTGTQDVATITGLGTLATQNGTFSGTSSGTNTGDQDLSPYATKAATLDQFADVTQTGTLTISASTTLSGGTHSGTNTGDQTSVTGNAGTVTTINGRISAGSNVTLSGTGTAVDPYVISSTAAGGGGGTVTTLSVTTANGVSGSVANATTTPAITLTLGAITPSSVAAVGTVTGSNLSGTNTGDNAVNSLYSGLVSNATHSGDATGSTVLTLATVNANVGSFGSSTAIPTFTVNGKGLITAAGTAAVVAPAGTLSGSTLNATVTGSSLTSVGTIGTGTWQGTAVADTYIASAATWNAKQAAITFGTGVQTALGVNVGSAGAPVLFGGAAGTPASITLTNGTGLPVGGLAQSGATSGQVPTWNGSAWAPATPSGGGGSSGTATLGSDYTLTSTGSFEDTGLSVSLPAAGTYLVSVNARCTLLMSSGKGYISCKLYNSTAAADVTDSVRLIFLSIGTNECQLHTGYSWLVTVGAASVIKFYAGRFDGGSASFTASIISSDANGWTTMSYLSA